MTTSLLDRSEAAERLRALRADRRDAVGVERAPLGSVAGRTLAEPIVAEEAVPPRNYATMDGFAFDSGDDYPLRLVDEAAYPEDERATLPDGHAARVATGAPLPEGADAVLMRERAEVGDDRLDGPPLDPGTNVHRRGSTVEAGETVYDRGVRLAARDAVLLTDLGVESVPVARRLSVGVLATGTEIHEGAQPDRDTDMLCNLVRGWSHDPVAEGSVPDDADRIRTAIDDLADRHDVVVTTGGTSVGHKDFVVDALDSLGELTFQGVALRPGRPTTAARLDDGTLALALPGKPIAAYVGATLVGRALFVGGEGDSAPGHPTIRARLACDLDVPGGDLEYAVPVLLDGERATPFGHPASGTRLYERTFVPSRVSSNTGAVRADGVVLLTAAESEGTAVDVIPFSGLE